MSDSVIPDPESFALPGDGLASAIGAFAAQYATAILTAAIVAKCFFPGHAFILVPWLYDDYRNLSSHLDYSPCHPIDFFVSRPVSTNVIAYLSAAGETTISW